jgi:hypothetical protein
MKSQIFYNADGASSGGGTAVASAPAPNTVAPTPSPTPQSPLGDVTPAHWSHSYDGLEDGVKGHSSLLPFKTPSDAVKAYVKLQPLIGAKEAFIPKDWNNAEEVATFASKVGRPEAAKGYEIGDIPLPEGFELDNKMVDSFKEMAHKAALSPWQVQAIIKDYTKLQTESTLSEHNQILKDRQSRLSNFERQLGSTIKFQEERALAEHALNVYGDGELQSILNDNGLKDEPAFIKALARMGRDVKEGRAHTTPAQNAVFNSGTPEGATQKIAELKLNKEFMQSFLNAADPGHKESVEMWQRLHKIQAQSKK